jgi:SWIM zinc finger
MALAPDAGALSAAVKLAIPEPWMGRGSNERAVWGSCRGSAKQPYDVVCDSLGPAYRCTCPSRKFPCQHALALLLLWARGLPPITDGDPPADAAAWLAGRLATEAHGTFAEAVEGKQVLSPDAGAGSVARHQSAPKPDATAARLERRARRIVAGMAELDRWLGDLLRHGFGHAQSQPYRYWDAMAARLVDAQAPAAAARVRRLAGIVRSGTGWPARLLSQVARLHLLAVGWSRYESLPEPTQADLRTAAGWPWPSDQVLAREKEPDRWFVLARRVTEDEQVRAQRTWLWGLGTGRVAVIVDFARPRSGVRVGAVAGQRA